MALILVMDDDDIFRSLVRNCLELVDHEVMEAANGLEGLKLCKDHTFDLVISDLIMPDKEGLETITEIKKKYPNTPIIAVSAGIGQDASNYLNIAKKLGAQLTLQKPVETQDLLEATEKLLTA